MEEKTIDMQDLTEYILEKAKEQGVALTEEVVDLVLDLEDDYLNEHGFIEYSDED